MKKKQSFKKPLLNKPFSENSDIKDFIPDVTIQTDNILLEIAEIAMSIEKVEEVELAENPSTTPISQQKS